MIARHFQITVALLLVGVLSAGVYMLKLREGEKGKSNPAAGDRPLTAPVTAAEENIKLMIAYDDDGVLSTKETKIRLPEDPEERTREILRSLLAFYSENPSPHPLAAKADVRNVFIVEGGLCVVDLNAAFADQHRSGILVEEFSIASMVETISMNAPGVTRVKFLVEGAERETLAGHADLGTIYEVAKIHDLVKELQPN